MPTLTINNFGGRLTRFRTGDINSGFAKYSTTFGMDPFTYPSNLTWGEQATRIDSGGTVITDLIMAAKPRVESGITYVYAIGHLGRLYKIQVNDPTSYNPAYNNAVLLATLTSQSPTFTRGASIEFYGSTERIYISSDMGVTQINFDGTNETFVGSTASWNQTVPHPMVQFLGNLVVGDANNIATIDSSLSVTNYTRLSPAFPDGTQVRDLDVSPDGNYLQAVVSRLSLPDLTATTQDTTFLSNADSYIFWWNGISDGYTSYQTFPSFSLNTNVTFSEFQYTFGYDLTGGVVYNPYTKILTPVLSQSPLPNAVSSNGNMLGWTAPEYIGGFSKASTFLYGSLDNEVGPGWWRQGVITAGDTETDILKVPLQIIVSNFGIGSSTNGYSGAVFGFATTYISTIEVSDSPTTDYKLYKQNPVSTGSGTPFLGVYETQTQLFSKKITVGEVRIYGRPWIANNSFTVDLIGADDSAITGGSKTFTAGSNLTVGEDFAWYTPYCEPVYALGLKITNAGTANHTITKVEIDYTIGGK